MRVSEITSFLEHAYGVLNDTYFESSLPPVVITVQSSPKAYIWKMITTWNLYANCSSIVVWQLLSTI